MKLQTGALFNLSMLIGILFLSINPSAFSQGKLSASTNGFKIPLELQPKDLAPGSKFSIVVSNSTMMPPACTGSGNNSVSGFMQCSDESDAILNTDRNDWWNCCAPPNAMPSETYEYNFPSIESVYPCVAGTPVDELILTITINSVIFDLSSPYACCETYFEGIFGNLYDDCPPGSDCFVSGDGIVNNGNPGTGDCAASGDHLNYDAAGDNFPLGIPFTSTTTCMAATISTNESFGVDIVPSFRYEDALANGCNCAVDLVSQGLVMIDFDIEVEYVFCSDNLPPECFPATFTNVGPLCETDAAVPLPTTSVNGYNGSWSPATINPAGQGGNTITAVFTPNPGQCVGGTTEMEVEIEEATVPTFTQIGPLCETDAPVPLPSSSTNGVNGTWDQGPNFDPSGQGGNTVTITFTPNAGQCAAIETMDIVVNTGTVPNFTTIGPLCEGDNPVPLPSTSTNGVNGTWDVGTTFDPAGQGGNTVTISFTPDAGECATMTSLDIVVDAETIPDFVQIGPLCETDAPVPLPSSSTNGVSGSWDVGTDFDPIGQGGNTVTINFTPDAGQCAAAQTMDIVVEDEITPTFPGYGPLCENDPPFPLPPNSTGGTPGSWDIGTEIDPTGLGGTTVTIIWTPDPGNCVTQGTLQVSILEGIVPFFDPIGPLCETDSPVALPSTSLNGINGSWDVGPSFNPFGQGGNIVTIVFTPDAGPCASMTTMDIVVDEPMEPIFSPIGPLCEADSPVTLPTVSLNGISGTWDVGPTFDPLGLGGNTVTITFTPNFNECANGTTIDIVVESGVVPIFDPIGPLCENDMPVALPAVSLNGVSGTWDVGPTFDPTGLGGTTEVITFTPTVGVCANSTILAIEVTEDTEPTFAAIGPFCEDDAPFVLPTQSIEGLIGTWDVGTTFDPTGLGGTSVDIVFTSNAGQCGGMQTVSVQVNELPQNDILDVSCNSNLMDYFVDFETDGDLVTSTAGTVIDNGGGDFTIDDIPEGTDITVTVTNTTTDCVSTFEVTSPSCNCPTIDPPIGNDAEICEGEMIPTLSVTVDAGLEVDWYDAASGGVLLLENSTDYTPAGAGIYYAEAIEASSGCTSNIRAAITLTILPLDTTYVQDSSCLVSEVGMDTTIFATATCDSVVITTTTLMMGEEFFFNATSCDPADVGTDTLFLMDQGGCDSLVITTTTLSPADTTFQAPTTTCDPMEVGIDTIVYATATCDSVVISTTTLLPSDIEFFNTTSCDPSQTGVDTLMLTNQLGCDSIVITTTLFDPLPPVFLQATSCNSMEVGIDTTVFQTAMNCDSMVITTTTLIPGVEVFQTATSCDPAEVGIDTAFLMNSIGCDSLVITTISLSAADTTSQTASTCDPALVGLDTMVFATATCDSVVITTTSLMMGDVTNLMDTSCDLADIGLDTLVLSNQMGCDSLVVTETTFQAIPPTFLQAGTCDPAMVGIDTTILSTNGCDSMVITNSVLLPASESFQMASSCDPANVGIDTLILMNSIGCDSLVITTTSLSDADTTFTTATSCDISQVGIDTMVFVNPLCDSVVITTTTLIDGDIVFQNETTCDPMGAGLDTLFLFNQNGCDSLVITTTVVEIIPPTLLQSTTCSPMEVGLDTLTFSTATCDSLVITNTTLVQGDEMTFDLTTCVPSEAGVDTLFLTNQNGCDSLIITSTILTGGIEDAEIIGVDPTCLAPDGSISILNVTGGEEPYLYSIDGGATFSTFADFSPLAAGDYDIFIEDANGCGYEAMQSLIGELSPQLVLSPDEVILPLGESYFLDPALVGSLATATWTPAEFLSCADCLTTTATPLENTFYTISIIDENGCTATASISILVDERLRVYMPNAFSPNGDGINDIFTVLGNENQISQVDQLLIFDRWGGKVFEQLNFPVNDFAYGWDGTKDGEIMQLGVYVFLANITLKNGEEVMLEGDITLIR